MKYELQNFLLPGHSDPVFVCLLDGQIGHLMDCNCLKNVVFMNRLRMRLN